MFVQQRPWFPPRRVQRAPRRRRGRSFVVAQALGVETKFFDTEATDDAFALTWATMEPATTNLTAIAQGDGESNRDGRNYVIKSIHVRGWIELPAAEAAMAPSADVLGRICLVWDTQTNGAQLTATDVMDGGQTEDFLAFRNLQFTKRFRILKDKHFNLKVTSSNMAQGAVNLFAHGTVKQTFKWDITFKTPLQVTTSGTGADIANVTDNSIHIIGVASQVASLLNYQCRVRFVG